VKFPIVAAIACAVLGGCATMGAGAAPLAQGSWILARWDDGVYYPGVVQTMTGTKISVLYDDGTTREVSRRHVRPYDWQIGTIISCQLTEGVMTTVTISTMGPETTDLGVVDAEGNHTATLTGKCREA
jgi:hypothetical protein